MKPYRFEPTEEEVVFCVLERPHGTVLELTVDFFSEMVIQGEHYRSHHLELHGGLCTTETNYHSHFSMALSRLTTEDELVDFAIRFANDQFNKLHPRGQFELFKTYQ
jgi:hypothetical protein